MVRLICCKMKIMLECMIYVVRNGTSMISLIIPPKDQISRVSKMLADELGTASNIKSRVNRLSVLGAITSVQQKLKLYTKGRWITNMQWFRNVLCMCTYCCINIERKLNYLLSFLQWVQMALWYTVAQLSRKKEKKRKSTSTLSLSNRLTLLCTCATTR